MPFPSRRNLLKSFAAVLAAPLPAPSAPEPRPTVSIVRIPNGNVAYAVERAIDLLGGMRTLTKGRNRILLKPNLVCPQANATTNPTVIRTLARLMAAAGKDVSIAEGAHLMGFDASEIPTFAFANRAGMRPGRLEEIELRGDPPENVRKKFARPLIVPWALARGGWATREI